MLGLHPRNLHNQGYDFPALVKGHPVLAPYVKPNAHGDLSIDFADPLAVKTLNAALLNRYYYIVDWDIPEGALCPPIPGRAGYIHCMADVPGLEQPSIKLLDIGTEANGIYPPLASQMCGWQCVGSDINIQSLANVARIVANNPTLKDRFTLRTQHDRNHIFERIIQAGEFFDVSVCDPPFQASLDEALKGSQLKLNNLARSRGEQKAKTKSPTRNFGGLGAVDRREIEMKQGNKTTRVLAWTFI
ncbi:RlmF-related methyltransferase [Marinobacter caseinilyticus]|uniref:RlmF-related methyltransferase n=1 Tax=Marinobacter caseinilyticus TaxID=2692195 RepID=UPI001F3C1554|nr:RlmF-related methyltransferase [Marinobacter caseinilyticus]